MRILHFIKAYPSLSETFIKKFVEKTKFFAKSGVVTYTATEKSESGIKIYQLPERHYTRKNIAGLGRFIREKSTGKLVIDQALIDVVRQFHPDLIHCHYGVMGVKLMKVFQQFKVDVPFVTTFYGYDASSLPLLDKQYASDLYALWEHGNAFLAEGPAMAEKLQKLGAPPEKVHINPLLIPVQEYSVKKSYRRSNETVRFLIVGRFTEKKGFHLFFEALGKIQSKMPDFWITAVGYGPMEAQYKEIIQRFGYTERVNFLGMQPHDQVLQHLAQHDFFVHPSLTAADGDSEGGAPTVIIEAQAVGIPVITSDHADIPFVMGYHDFLCKEGDSESLQRSIIKSVQWDSWPAYAEKGMALVNRQHNITSNIYPDILEKVLVGVA